MPRPRRPVDPFVIKLNADQRKDLTEFLCTEVQTALDSRTGMDAQVAYWHRLYEQGLTRIGKQQPWADAADLTSYIGTEKVDALRSRIMRTIFVEPIWTVEGFTGSAAKQAPIVEEFHQYEAEQEGLQWYLARAIHLSLIEPRGVLEVYEDSVERRTRSKKQIAIQLDPFTASPMYDDKGEPVLVTGPDGKYIEVQDNLAPSAEVILDSVERVRRGPAYRVIPYRDFLVLPEHASDKSDIWGYAKRFVRRISDLKDRAEAGVYDKEAVEALGTQPDNANTTTDLSNLAVQVAPQTDPDTTEKTLWEVLCLRDLDGNGQRWYVATVSVEHRQILRIQHDDIGQPRFLIFVPFPRPDRACEGFSFIGHKLITTIEEHTAWRNMLADRAALLVQAPIKRVEGALWDPDDQPIGPKQVITVRDMREVEAFDIPDLTAPAVEREREILAASERVAGINDVAMGTTPEQKRTLGEINIVTEQSFVRMDEVIRNLQETIEDLGQLRHVIWQRALAELSEGVPLPQGMLVGLETRGIEIDKSMPAQALKAAMAESAYRFKPRGSVETADNARMRGDFVQFVQLLPLMIQLWPAMGQQIGGNLAAAQSVLEQAVRLYRFPDKQAFTGSNLAAAMTPPAAGMLPGAAPSMPPPGLPPGMPMQPPQMPMGAEGMA